MVESINGWMCTCWRIYALSSNGGSRWRVQVLSRNSFRYEVSHPKRRTGNLCSYITQHRHQSVVHEGQDRIQLLYSSIYKTILSIEPLPNPKSESICLKIKRKYQKISGVVPNFHRHRPRPSTTFDNRFKFHSSIIQRKRMLVSFGLFFVFLFRWKSGLIGRE